jgi:hypothetical protein
LAKLLPVAPLLAAAALWVNIQTSLKDTKCVIKAKECPTHSTLYQERAVFGKVKMDPAKPAQTQNAGEVSLLQWFFAQSVELMTDKVLRHCIRPMLLK